MILERIVIISQAKRGRKRRQKAHPSKQIRDAREDLLQKKRGDEYLEL